MRTHTFKIMAFALSLFLMQSCGKNNYDLPVQPLSNYIKVYMPQAVNNPVNVTLLITDSLQSIIYGANYGGQDYPTQDIPLTFSVNNALIDSFNLANNTNYSMMPDNTYTMSVKNAIIPEGKLSTQALELSIRTNGENSIEAMKNYLLPISISIPKSDVNINEKLRTTFYVIKAQPNFSDYTNFNRAHWTVIGFSSQEANGEGPANGKAIFALDEDPNTFWHTQWQGASPGPPHYVTIDMGETKTIHGLAFLDRQNDGSGKPNLVNIQTSKDNIVWEDAGTFNLQNTQNLQKQFLSGFKVVRYFKVNILSSYNATYTHLAELNAF